MTLVIEGKPRLESVISTIGQLNAYDTLPGDTYRNKILLIVTADKNDRFDSMINDQGMHIFHIPALLGDDLSRDNQNSN